jgi:hypothetical protein
LVMMKKIQECFNKGAVLYLERQTPIGRFILFVPMTGRKRP